MAMKADMPSRSPGGAPESNRSSSERKGDRGRDYRRAADGGGRSGKEGGKDAGRDGGKAGRKEGKGKKETVVAKKRQHRFESYYETLSKARLNPLLRVFDDDYVQDDDILDVAGAGASGADFGFEVGRGRNGGDDIHKSGTFRITRSGVRCLDSENLTLAAVPIVHTPQISSFHRAFFASNQPADANSNGDKPILEGGVEDQAVGGRADGNKPDGHAERQRGDGLMGAATYVGMTAQKLLRDTRTEPVHEHLRNIMDLAKTLPLLLVHQHDIVDRHVLPALDDFLPDIKSVKKSERKLTLRKDVNESTLNALGLIVASLARDLGASLNHTDLCDVLTRYAALIANADQNASLLSSLASNLALTLSWAAPAILAHFDDFLVVYTPSFLLHDRVFIAQYASEALAYVLRSQTSAPLIKCLSLLNASLLRNTNEGSSELDSDRLRERWRERPRERRYDILSGVAFEIVRTFGRQIQPRRLSDIFFFLYDLRESGAESEASESAAPLSPGLELWLARLKKHVVEWETHDTGTIVSLFERCADDLLANSSCEEVSKKPTQDGQANRICRLLSAATSFLVDMPRLKTRTASQNQIRIFKLFDRFTDFLPVSHDMAQSQTKAETQTQTQTQTLRGSEEAIHWAVASSLVGVLQCATLPRTLVDDLIQRYLSHPAVFLIGEQPQALRVARALVLAEKRWQEQEDNEVLLERSLLNRKIFERASHEKPLRHPHSLQTMASILANISDPPCAGLQSTVERLKHDTSLLLYTEVSDGGSKTISLVATPGLRRTAADFFQALESETFTLATDEALADTVEKFLAPKAPSSQELCDALTTDRLQSLFHSLAPSAPPRSPCSLVRELQTDPVKVAAEKRKACLLFHIVANFGSCALQQLQAEDETFCKFFVDRAIEALLDSPISTAVSLLRCLSLLVKTETSALSTSAPSTSATESPSKRRRLAREKGGEKKSLGYDKDSAARVDAGSEKSTIHKLFEVCEDLLLSPDTLDNITKKEFEIGRITELLLRVLENEGAGRNGDASKNGTDAAKGGKAEMVEEKEPTVCKTRVGDRIEVRIALEILLRQMLIKFTPMWKCTRAALIKILTQNQALASLLLKRSFDLCRSALLNLAVETQAKSADQGLGEKLHESEEYELKSKEVPRSEGRSELVRGRKSKTLETKVDAQLFFERTPLHRYESMGERWALADDDSRSKLLFALTYKSTVGSDKAAENFLALFADLCGQLTKKQLGEGREWLRVAPFFGKDSKESRGLTDAIVHSVHGALSSILDQSPQAAGEGESDGTGTGTQGEDFLWVVPSQAAAVIFLDCKPTPTVQGIVGEIVRLLGCIHSSLLPVTDASGLNPRELERIVKGSLSPDTAIKLQESVDSELPRLMAALPAAPLQKQVLSVLEYFIPKVPKQLFEVLQKLTDKKMAARNLQHFLSLDLGAEKSRLQFLAINLAFGHTAHTQQSIRRSIIRSIVDADMTCTTGGNEAGTMGEGAVKGAQVAGTPTAHPCLLALISLMFRKLLSSTPQSISNGLRSDPSISAATPAGTFAETVAFDDLACLLKRIQIPVPTATVFGLEAVLVTHTSCPRGRTGSKGDYKQLQNQLARWAGFLSLLECIASSVRRKVDVYAPFFRDTAVLMLAILTRHEASISALNCADSRRHLVRDLFAFLRRLHTVWPVEILPFSQQTFALVSHYQTRALAILPNATSLAVAMPAAALTFLLDTTSVISAVSLHETWPEKLGEILASVSGSKNLGSQLRGSQSLPPMIRLISGFVHKLLSQRSPTGPRSVVITERGRGPRNRTSRLARGRGKKSETEGGSHSDSNSDSDSDTDSSSESESDGGRGAGRRGARSGGAGGLEKDDDSDDEANAQQATRERCEAIVNKNASAIIAYLKFIISSKVASAATSAADPTKDDPRPAGPSHGDKQLKGVDKRRQNNFELFTEMKIIQSLPENFPATNLPTILALTIDLITPSQLRNARQLLDAATALVSRLCFPVGGAACHSSGNVSEDQQEAGESGESGDSGESVQDLYERVSDRLVTLLKARLPQFLKQQVTRLLASILTMIARLRGSDEGEEETSRLLLLISRNTLILDQQVDGHMRALADFADLDCAGRWRPRFVEIFAIVVLNLMMASTKLDIGMAASIKKFWSAIFGAARKAEAESIPEGELKAGETPTLTAPPLILAVNKTLIPFLIRQIGTLKAQSVERSCELLVLYASEFATSRFALSFVELHHHPIFAESLRSLSREMKLDCFTHFSGVVSRGGKEEAVISQGADAGTSQGDEACLKGPCDFSQRTLRQVLVPYAISQLVQREGSSDAHNHALSERALVFLLTALKHRLQFSDLVRIVQRLVIFVFGAVASPGGEGRKGQSVRAAAAAGVTGKGAGGSRALKSRGTGPIDRRNIREAALPPIGKVKETVALSAASRLVALLPHFQRLAKDGDKLTCEDPVENLSGSSRFGSSGFESLLTSQLIPTLKRLLIARGSKNGSGPGAGGQSSAVGGGRKGTPKELRPLVVAALMKCVSMSQSQAAFAAAYPALVNGIAVCMKSQYVAPRRSARLAFRLAIESLSFTHFPTLLRDLRPRMKGDLAESSLLIGVSQTLRLCAARTLTDAETKALATTHSSLLEMIESELHRVASPNDTFTNETLLDKKRVLEEARRRQQPELLKFEGATLLFHLSTQAGVKPLLHTFLPTIFALLNPSASKNSSHTNAYRLAASAYSPKYFRRAADLWKGLLSAIPKSRVLSLQTRLRLNCLVAEFAHALIGEETQQRERRHLDSRSWTQLIAETWQSEEASSFKEQKATEAKREWEPETVQAGVKRIASVFLRVLPAPASTTSQTTSRTTPQASDRRMEGGDDMSSPPGAIGSSSKGSSSAAGKQAASALIEKRRQAHFLVQPGAATGDGLDTALQQTRSAYALSLQARLMGETVFKNMNDLLALSLQQIESKKGGGKEEKEDDGGERVVELCRVAALTYVGGEDQWKTNAAKCLLRLQNYLRSSLLKGEKATETDEAMDIEGRVIRSNPFRQALVQVFESNMQAILKETLRCLKSLPLSPSMAQANRASFAIYMLRFYLHPASRSKMRHTSGEEAGKEQGLVSADVRTALLCFVAHSFSIQTNSEAIHNIKVACFQLLGQLMRSFFAFSDFTSSADSSSLIHSGLTEEDLTTLYEIGDSLTRTICINSSSRQSLSQKHETKFILLARKSLIIFMSRCPFHPRAFEARFLRIVAQLSFEEELGRLAVIETLYQLLDSHPSLRPLAQSSATQNGSELEFKGEGERVAAKPGAITPEVIIALLVKVCTRLAECFAETSESAGVLRESVEKGEVGMLIHLAVLALERLHFALKESLDNVARTVLLQLRTVPRIGTNGPPTAATTQVSACLAFSHVLVLYWKRHGRKSGFLFEHFVTILKIAAAAFSLSGLTESLELDGTDGNTMGRSKREGERKLSKLVEGYVLPPEDVTPVHTLLFILAEDIFADSSIPQTNSSSIQLSYILEACKNNSNLVIAPFVSTVFEVSPPKVGSSARLLTQTRILSLQASLLAFLRGNPAVFRGLFPGAMGAKFERIASLTIRSLLLSRDADACAYYLSRYYCNGLGDATLTLALMGSSFGEERD